MGTSAMMWNIEESFSDKWYPWVSLILTMHAPTNDAKKALPTDITSPSNVIDKTVFLFHEETMYMFQANEDQPTLWAPKGTKVIQPKSKGSGIMISDFICEQWVFSINRRRVRASQAARPHHKETCKAVVGVQRS